MTIIEYKKLLSDHDWHYNYSDDHGVWQRGERESAAITRYASTGTDEFKKAYNEAHALRYNNSSFVTDKNPYTFPYTIKEQ